VQQETVQSADALKGTWFASPDRGLAAGTGGCIWKYAPKLDF
jgi:hypothetical protein